MSAFCWVWPVSSSICVAMQEQLAPALGIMGPEPRRVLVGGDVDAEQPRLAPLDPGVGVGQGDPTGAQGLHLAALEGEAALEGLEDVVVVPGPTVAGHGLDPVGAVVGDAPRRSTSRSFAAATRRTVPPAAAPRNGTSVAVSAVRVDGRRPGTLDGDAPAARRRLRRDRGPLPAAGSPTRRAGCSVATRRRGRGALLPDPQPRRLGQALHRRPRASTSGPIATPRRGGSRSSASSTPTPTPTPTRRPPTSPRRPTRGGTTCSCRCATPIPRCARTASTGTWSTRSRWWSSPGDPAAR